MSKKIECPVCGGVAWFTREEREVQVGKRSAVVADEFYRCTACGEELYEPGQADAAMRRASDAIRAELGLLTAQEIKGIRERLNLSQADFERLLGVGPKTVVRWERGTVFQNQSADSLLRALDSVDGVAAFLGRQKGVHIHPAGLPKDLVVVIDSDVDDLVAADRFVPSMTETPEYLVEVGFDWAA